MPSVKDNNGKEWSFSVNVASLARVKENLGFDLLSVAGDAQALPRLHGDPVHLINCLYWLCKADVPVETFQEGWSGESIEAAYSAICEGIIGFFPSCRRQIVKQFVETFTEIMATARELAPQELQNVKEAALEAMRKQSGGQSGTAPESSELTPEASLSGS